MRCESFIVTLAITGTMAYVFLPPNHASYATFEIDGTRGLYNSAWIGTTLALLTSGFLSLIGFYLVKDAIDRDRVTRVGQVLAATPVRRLDYIAAKTLSNLAVLGAIVVALVPGAIAMQLARGEDRSVDLVALVAPFIAITLPVLVFVAAVAVFFEAAPVLRGGLGNVAYFFLWGALLAVSAWSGAGGAPFPLDFIGMSSVVPSIVADAQTAFPARAIDPTHMNIGINFRGSSEVWDLQTFEWRGLDWRRVPFAARAAWLAIAAAIVVAASMVFDRFGGAARVSGALPREGFSSEIELHPAGVGSRAVSADTRASSTRGARLAPLSARSRGNFAVLLVAELRLIAKGRRWWWIIALGLAAACLLAPVPVTRAWLLPFAWIWPIFRWSEMGTREARFGTDAILFASPRPIRRQLPAAWAAGFVLAVVAAAGAVVRFGILGEWSALIALLAGAAFVPALALAMGIWSGHRRLFEAFYLALWYIGPMNRVPLLDYTGASTAADRAVIAQAGAYALIAAFLLVAAAVGRRRQISQ
jgi:hypothetical protein